MPSSCQGIKATCVKTEVSGKVFAGGTAVQNLIDANMAVAPINAELTASTGNEYGSVFHQNEDGSISISVSVSDNKRKSNDDAMNELREATVNPVGDQHTHPGLPLGTRYAQVLSEGDIDSADALATIMEKAFNRTIVDGPSGRVISYNGRPRTMIINKDGSFQRNPDASQEGSATIIGQVNPIPYFDTSKNR